MAPRQNAMGPEDERQLDAANDRRRNRVRPTRMTNDGMPIPRPQNPGQTATHPPDRPWPAHARRAEMHDCGAGGTQLVSQASFKTDGESPLHAAARLLASQGHLQRLNAAVEIA